MRLRDCVKIDMCGDSPLMVLDSVCPFCSTLVASRLLDIRTATEESVSKVGMEDARALTKHIANCAGHGHIKLGVT